MGRKMKIGGNSLIWMAIQADDPTMRVGGVLYDKLYNAKESAKRSIFQRATIELSDDEIATLRKILKRGIEDSDATHAGRRSSRQALDELERKAGIKPSVIVVKRRKTIKKRKTGGKAESSVRLSSMR